MSAEQTAIVLVHGAWHGGWCWDRVVPLLEQRGLAVRTVDLPSVGADPAAQVGLFADAAAVRSVLDEAAGPVLLCGHSYGGMVITQAAAEHPSVVRLVYLCAFMPEVGDSLLGIVGEPGPPWLQVRDDGTMLPDLSQAADVFYGDCDPESQERATSLLRPMSAAAFTERVSGAAWHDIPSTYVVGANDNALPPELQRDVFAPRADETVELATSHSPFFSQPAVVAELLAQRASV